MSVRQAEYEGLDGLTPDEWDNTLEAVASGEHTNAICTALGVRRTTFARWLDERPDKASDLRRAKKLRAEARAEQAVDAGTAQIGKDDAPGARINVDTLKWAAEKDDPEAYGKAAETVTSFGSLHLTIVKEINAAAKAGRLQRAAHVLSGAEPAQLATPDPLDLSHLLDGA